MTERVQRARHGARHGARLVCVGPYVVGPDTVTLRGHSPWFAPDTVAARRDRGRHPGTRRGTSTPSPSPFGHPIRAVTLGCLSACLLARFGINSARFDAARRGFAPKGFATDASGEQFRALTRGARP